MAKRQVFLVVMMMIMMKRNRYIFHTIFGVKLNFRSAGNAKLIFHATCAIVYYGKEDVNCFLNKKGEKFASKNSRKGNTFRTTAFFSCTIPVALNTKLPHVFYHMLMLTSFLNQSHVTRGNGKGARNPPKR